MPQEGLASHDVFFAQQVEQPLMMNAAQTTATSVMMDFIFWFFDVQAARSSPNRLVCDRNQPDAIVAQQMSLSIRPCVSAGSTH